MDVSATTICNRPAQPLPVEICDMKEHLLTSPFNSRQITHTFWKHASFFTIFIQKNAQQQKVCKSMASYMFRPEMAFFRTVVVKRNSKMCQYYTTRCNNIQFIYICKLLYMFRVVFPPIIRSSYHCTYSICYLSFTTDNSNGLINDRYFRYSDMSS